VESGQDPLRSHHRGLLEGAGLAPILFAALYLELNPIEYIWSYLKTSPLANLTCPDVAVLAATGRRHTRLLQHKPTCYVFSSATVRLLYVYTQDLLMPNINNWSIL
jgi:transposase